MNFHFQNLIPDDFNDNSRVWIYQCNRLFILDEALQIEELLEDFTKTWLSHGAIVKGYANLFFGQFIVLMADESATGVSGCSTDSSVRLIKNIEQDYNVNLFDRQTLAFVLKERIQLLPMDQLDNAIAEEFINADTLYFNNTVQTKNELLNRWIIPVKESWLAKRFSFAT
ncbi:MAG: hypothetical protein WKF59_22110 [Chitinophagaceae bacterium]